ncbi:MAG: glycosyltransferase [Candidatus Sumerlaeia bacterium]
MKDIRKLRVALVHDWLNGMRGGEHVLEDLCDIWPTAHIHTLFYEPDRMSEKINAHPIHPSPLQKLPFTRRWYRHLLPLFPWAVDRMDLRGYDLVVSISHCAVKAAPVPESIPHLCYCLSPARYLYDQADRYFGNEKGPKAWLRKKLLDRMRRWDRETASRPTAFVGISHFISRRIERVYARKADVVYPAVNTDFYTPDPETERDDFFLIVCAATPYKKIDVAVEAFNKLGLRLKVVGKGPELARLQKMAGPTIELHQWLEEDELRQFYRRARGFVFVAEEDFGITPLEAQACGCPVIGYGSGGLAETIIDGKTGLHFSSQTPEALIEKLKQYRPEDFDSKDIRENAMRFSPDRFQQEFLQALRSVMF